MEIKNLNNRMISAYKSVSGGVQPKGKGASAGASEKAGSDNFDKVEFDFGLSKEAAKANIAANITADADAARIEMLQASYDGDSLPVTTGQIADSILG